jgi:hypothetical protein
MNGQKVNGFMRIGSGSADSTMVMQLMPPKICESMLTSCPAGVGPPQTINTRPGQLGTLVASARVYETQKAIKQSLHYYQIRNTRPLLLGVFFPLLPSRTHLCQDEKPPTSSRV